MGLADILVEELESTVVRSAIGDRTFDNSLKTAKKTKAVF